MKKLQISALHKALSAGTAAVLHEQQFAPNEEQKEDILAYGDPFPIEVHAFAYAMAKLFPQDWEINPHLWTYEKMSTGAKELKNHATDTDLSNTVEKALGVIIDNLWYTVEGPTVKNLLDECLRFLSEVRSEEPPIPFMYTTHTTFGVVQVNHYEKEVAFREWDIKDEVFVDVDVRNDGQDNVTIKATITSYKENVNGGLHRHTLEEVINVILHKDKVTADTMDLKTFYAIFNRLSKAQMAKVYTHFQKAFDIPLHYIEVKDILWTCLKGNQVTKVEDLKKAFEEGEHLPF